MTTRRYLIGFTFLVFCSIALATSKSDLAKEKRWAEQIVPSLILGEEVTLSAAGSKFLAIYAENSTDSVKGGVILLHGIGAHPAWPDVINPLRISLPEHGWHTLSLQMPILPNEATAKDYPPLFDEVPARIQAGVDYLRTKGVRNIVIIAHSLGTTMSTYYLASKKDPAVRGFVAVALVPGLASDPRMDSYANFSKVTIPTLDIFGSQDFEVNVNTAGKRQQIANSAGNKRYSQIKVDGANHFFSNMDDILVKHVSNWLDKNATGNPGLAPK